MTFCDISDMTACVQCLCILDFFCTILQFEYVCQLNFTVGEEDYTHFLPGAVKGVCVVKFVVFATKIKLKIS